MAVMTKVFPTDQVVAASAQYLAEYLQKLLTEHKQVMVLLSGGSSIDMYKAAFAQLPEDLSLSPIIFGLVDERFVAIDHPDSNETQLRNKGVVTEIEKRGGRFMGLLSTNKKLTGVEVAAFGSKRYQSVFDWAEYIVFLAGLGPDGHTAGWLPTQTESKFKELYESDRLITYYEVEALDTDNPHLHRITSSLKAVQYADQVIVYAKGADKKEALKKFVKNTTSINQIPALALYQSKQPVIVLTDQKV